MSAGNMTRFAVIKNATTASVALKNLVISIAASKSARLKSANQPSAAAYENVVSRRIKNKMVLVSAPDLALFSKESRTSPLMIRPRW